MTAPALSVCQLTVNYGHTPVLWDINFDLPPGNVVGILGPNGAGKSTLLKTCLGLIHPLSGCVKFLGSPLSKVRKRVAYVPQRESVDWDFPITVMDLVLMGRYGRLGLFRRPKREDYDAVKQALQVVGLTELSQRQISQLSGGQQQRAFLARALVQEAEVYLLDEPFAGVDLTTEQILIERLWDLRNQGKTVCIVHHDLNTVESYFDWVVLLNLSLVASGSVKETFTPEVLEATYGRSHTFLDEAAKLSRDRASGLS